MHMAQIRIGQACFAKRPETETPAKKWRVRYYLMKPADCLCRQP
jgi:hypothetical protein